jgi:polyisoprenoid-binding protein YceI
MPGLELHAPYAHWLAFLAITMFAATTTPAEERSQLMALDASRSSVEFEVKLLWLVGVHGRFDSLRGTVAVDRFRNSATVDVHIDTNAVTMRSKSHEDWVKSEEFFDAPHYPEIEFVSESIPLQRLQSGGAIDGKLTLRGVTKPVRFELAVPDCKIGTDQNCPVRAAGSIRRSEFGMSSRRGALSDKVELSFSIETVPLASDPNR